MIKAAIVGCGRHGLRFLQASKTVNGLKIGALVDKNPKTCEGITSSIFYVDLAKMLVDYKPNLVIIATTGPSHFEIAEKAIELGVQMLIISKPVTTSFSDALKLDKLIKKTGVKVAVDHALRHDATYNWIKKNLATNNWGDVSQVTIERSGIGLGCLATHSFDLANYIFDCFPANVTGWVDKPVNINPRGSHFVDPGGLVVLDYGNDKKAIISQVENTIRGVMMVTIYCEKCTIKIDIKNLQMTVESFDNKGNKDLKINPHNIQVSHDTTYLMKQIIIDIISNEKLTADFSFGLEALKILIGAYGSHDNGNIPLKLTDIEIMNFDKNLPIT